MSDHLQISIEADKVARRRQGCNQRMEILKATEFPSSKDSPSQPAILQQELFGKTNSEILELLQAVQNGNVDSFVDALEQLSSKKKLPLSAIFDQVTPAGDSLLHEAAYLGKAEIAELIGDHFPELLTRTNIKGDTPLHVAARSKSAGVMKLILSQYAAHKSTFSRENNTYEEITRMSNEYGNTALHEAVGSKDVEGVTLLFEADKYVTHYLNKSDKSPLYLAILSSSKDLVNILLEAPFPHDKPLPKCHGNSPLHAAIYKRNTDLMKEIVEKRPDLMFLKDEYEGTPLHYAVATSYAKGIHLLGNKSTLTALEWNSEGQLPIHLACKFGHIEVLKEFLEQKWADPRILLNKEGQNILHVASENGRKNVVQYLLKNTKFKQLSINEKDKNGNTPLHLAAKNFHCAILLSLTNESSIDVNIMNNEGLTARDIVLLKNTPVIFKQSLSNTILISAGAQMNSKAKGKLSKSEDRITANKEWLKNRVNTLIVVAILVVTVTFTAGLTVPGGFYSSDDPNPRKRGMPVFANRIQFQWFILFDVVAVYSSILGATILLSAQIAEVDLGLKLLSMASSMIMTALAAMIGTFMSAIFLVVSDVSWLASAFVYGFLMLSFLFYYVLFSLTTWRIKPSQFSLSFCRILSAPRRAFGLFRIKAYTFGYVPNY